MYGKIKKNVFDIHKKKHTFGKNISTGYKYKISETILEKIIFIYKTVLES